jgi:hypothetical protein
MTRLTWIVFALNLFACAAAPSTEEHCGNGVCDEGETAATCEEDCARPDAGSGVVCGDHICQSSETQTSCPADCGTPQEVCGNGVCAGTETNTSCPHDCASTFIVDNLSSQTVYYLYAWRCGTTVKGTDLLGAGTLLPNYHVEYDEVQIGCWNLEADGLNSTLIYSQNSAEISAQVTYTWNVY